MVELMRRSPTHLPLITDTSPVQYLHQIHQLHLLPTLYGQVKMPQAVADELAEGLAQGIVLPAIRLVYRG